MNQNNQAIHTTLQMLSEGLVCHLVLSGPFQKDAPARKLVVTAIKTANALTYQAVSHRGAQVFHHNFAGPDALSDWLCEHLFLYRQCDFSTETESFTLLQSKKGAQKLIRAKAAPANAAQTHNRQKPYILPEGTPVAWLVALGIMLPDGKVPAAKQKKFKQINRFLEMAADVSDTLPDNARIIDAGCGKSYLTFALYDYLRRVQGKNVEITGLDLKADVVAHCAALAERLGFRALRFYAGDIAAYTPPDGRTDMVVSLHACDTATDYALYNAVTWGASIILSVPCCQHELYPQVQNDGLRPLLRHGILKERFAAMLTDALRAELLEAAGYSCTVMEFIDMEHTPKNLMLRAVRRRDSRTNEKALGEALSLMQQMQAAPTLYRLLEGGGFLCPKKKA